MAYITIDRVRRSIHMWEKKEDIFMGQDIMYQIPDHKLHIYEQFFIPGLVRGFGYIGTWHKIEIKILKAIQNEDKKRFENLI